MFLFFDNSPKRQQYFELRISFYGKKLQLNETKIAKRNKNWQDTAAGRMKNDVQSVIKNDDRKRNVEPAKQVDAKQQYQIDHPPDCLLETISLADYDLFPNIKKLLVIECISHIRSNELERAASGISKMGGDCESDLNLV